MKKVIYLSIFLLVLAIGTLGVLVGPYHFYSMVIENGIENDFLVLSPKDRPILEGHNYVYQRADGHIEEDERLWKNFHFENFIIPLPLHHPLILVIPKIEIVRNQDVIGLQYMNHSRENEFVLMIYNKKRFHLPTRDQKLFELPIFQKEIISRSSDEVWADLFRRNLASFEFSLAEPEKLRTFVDNLNYKGLVYNLFLAYLREKFFDGEKIERLSFFKSKGIGFVEKPSIDQRYSVEKLFLRKDGIVYEIEITFRKKSMVAEAIRRRFLTHLEVKPTDPQSASAIYSDYKSLPYHKKIDQEGMTYLYAAWTHSEDRKSFLQEMIQFLERGKENLPHLAPLYEYAFQRYGSSFTTKNQEAIKIESAQAKLERKIADEENEELKRKAQDDSDFYRPEFESDKDRVDYYLKKAKEMGEERGSNEGVLEN